MATWEILDAPDGEVINRIIATAEFVSAQYPYYREYEPPAPITPPVYTLTDLQISSGGVLVQANAGGNFFVTAQETVTVTATLSGGEAINTPLIKLVLTRLADGEPTAEEIYLSGSVVSGLLSVSGTLPVSTSYIVAGDRQNKLMDRIEAGYWLEFDPFYIVG
jgi:hypothetical protein